MHPPDASFVHLRLGLLYARDPAEDALAAFELIIELDHADLYPYAHEMRADSLRLLRRYIEALSCCDSALKTFPGNAGIINESFVLYYSRDYPAALVVFRDARVAGTDFAKLYRIATLRAMNRYDEAEAEALLQLPRESATC